MWTTDEINDAQQRLNDLFPSRFSYLLFQFQHYAQTMQRFDAIFFDCEPYLDVTLDKGFARALDAAISAKDAVRTALLFENVTFSAGSKANVDSVWMLNFMPPGGVTIAQMVNVDLAEAEVHAGPQGETVREMIRNTYGCATAAELDWFVRRWLAS
jgi:hypothetical protein